MNRRSFLSVAGASGLVSSASAQSIQAAAVAASPLAIGGGILVAASDAPPAIRRVATFRCDGVNDQLQIQQAFAALGAGGGLVQLSEGTFHLTAAVRVPRRGMLHGRGRSSVLRAAGSWVSFDGARPGALIEPADSGTDKTHIAQLALDGARFLGHDVGGIYYAIDDSASFDEGPDACHWFSDLYVFHTRQHGVHLSGNRMRATTMSRVRVYNSGADGVNVAHGFLIESPDGTYTELDSGSASGAGFHVDGTNNRFTNCKAWFSDLSGWEIAKPRCQLSACESQDNEQHGFYIGVGPTSLSACHADSNSWSSAAPVASFDGFHLPWGKDIQLVGCSAYDKNEGGRGNWQRFGVFMGSSVERAQIIMTARDNVSGGTGGAGAAAPGNLVMVASN